MIGNILMFAVSGAMVLFGLAQAVWPDAFRSMAEDPVTRQQSQRTGLIFIAIGGFMLLVHILFLTTGALRPIGPEDIVTP